MNNCTSIAILQKKMKKYPLYLLILEKNKIPDFCSKYPFFQFVEKFYDSQKNKDFKCENCTRTGQLVCRPKTPTKMKTCDKLYQEFFEDFKNEMTKQTQQ